MLVQAFLDPETVVQVREECRRIVYDHELEALSKPQRFQDFSDLIHSMSFEPSDFAYHLHFVDGDGTAELYGNFSNQEASKLATLFRQWLDSGLTIADFNLIYSLVDTEDIYFILSAHHKCYPSHENYEQALLENLDGHAREALEEYGLEDFLESTHYFFSSPPPTLIETPSRLLVFSNHHLLTP